MDAKPLPPRPNLEQYKKQAKDLLKACKSGDSHTIRAWAAAWIESWAAEWMETQARLRGVTVSPQVRSQIDREVDRLEKGIRSSKLSKSDVTLADAQFFIARAHGFESWSKFANHIEALARASSHVSTFESAVEAVVAGDVATLERLLRDNPELIRERSTRKHRSTLLHYVSANGVEDFRQKTPKNAVEIARLLLEAGAEVNAVSDAYGGGSTTLGLVATSIHPLRAGVQDALMELLLEYGAAIDGPGQGSAVNACLANGRAGAAEFLARRGARLDLEGAAGVGRLDLVKDFFNHNGSLKTNATKAQMESGLRWACEYGRTSVVEFLLDRGVAVGAPDKQGMTGLHWAAHGGHLDVVQLLLERKAPLEVKNSYGGTVLDQALWSSVHSGLGVDYFPVIETLIAAGAKVEPNWSTGNKRIDEVLRSHGAKS